MNLEGCMKPSLKSSQDIANQLRWDDRFDVSDFFVGFETRFEGLREMPLRHFLEHAEVPWHRVQYFRNPDGIQWDRRTRLDRIGHSGDKDAKPGKALSTGLNTMKAKDLLNIGIPQGKLIGETLELLKTHPKRFEPQSLEFELRELLRDPSAYQGHFAPIAQELAKPKPIARRAEPAPYRVWGEGLEAGALQQMKNAVDLPVAVAGALMPDAHQGYGLPIGGVLAVENAVIPYAVGVDIACRMKLSVLDIPVDTAFKRRFDDLKRALETETRFGMGGGFDRPLQHDVLDEDWSITRVTREVFAKARQQLGTSGSGNHFVEFGVLTLNHPDLGLEPGTYLALLSHSGSRGSGAAVAKRYSDLAMELHPELPKELKHLAWLEMTSHEGQEYWAAMNLMGRYAAANHALIHKKVAKALGADVLANVENHHNFAWLERHVIDGDSRDVYVHRKGATPAGRGVLGVIPGSMATPGFVVRGKGNIESLESASHGAGRAMSRTAAKERFNWKMVRPKLEAAGVTLLSAGIDENPFAYKDIDAVMKAQTDLVDVIARFDPRVVKMADDGTAED
jgi:tRNA-splicing ligase RtcB (3'-phosphate/5'-hydroxy nucleic acid ligase)